MARYFQLDKRKNKNKTIDGEESVYGLFVLN